MMEDFKAGRLDALVSTTVIEVGVDVPNASVMVIENAERYGLSALHQLRGRVGRGAAESWCFLVSDNQSENVQKRLKFLCSTTDGFAVAQYDLDERHPHPARCAGGSRCHAGRRPAAGSAGARTAGTAGAADVRESRSHELIRKFLRTNSIKCKSRCTAGAAAPVIERNALRAVRPCLSHRRTRIGFWWKAGYPYGSSQKTTCRRSASTKFYPESCAAGWSRRWQGR